MTTTVSKTIRSKFLEILMDTPDINVLPSDKMRERIHRIMTDMDVDGILDPIDYSDDTWGDDLDTISEIEFDEHRTEEEKQMAIEFLQKPKEDRRDENEHHITLESLKRIREKRRELAKNPKSLIVLTEEDIEPEDRDTDVVVVMPNSYGRSPLHEAIGMRNLDSISKFVEAGEYLDTIDNNGNTPYQMAFQEGYTEAVEIFENANVAA